MMECIRCECIITEINPLMKSTGTCQVCRDEEFNSAEDLYMDNQYSQFIIWSKEFLQITEKLNEPWIDSSENNSNLREYK